MQGDVITFNLTNATAFVLHGSTNNYRVGGIQVTVTPPETEGPPRVRIVNDSIPLYGSIEPEVMHYFESGLNRDSQYEVEIRNPSAGNVVDLTYLQILDAVPP
jgi:hypothetical protein